jgi:uncharacterized UBP type Zn finger protein
MARWLPQDGAGCGHADGLPVAPAAAQACEDCLRLGGRWVHLRRCLSCDHVGCCDSSPHRHASAHWHETQHPVAASAEPREHWAWCYADDALLLPTP